MKKLLVLGLALGSMVVLAGCCCQAEVGCDVGEEMPAACEGNAAQQKDCTKTGKDCTKTGKDCPTEKKDCPAAKSDCKTAAPAAEEK